MDSEFCVLSLKLKFFLARALNAKLCFCFFQTKHESATERATEMFAPNYYSNGPAIKLEGTVGLQHSNGLYVDKQRSFGDILLTPENIKNLKALIDLTNEKMDGEKKPQHNNNTNISCENRPTMTKQASYRKKQAPGGKDNGKHVSFVQKGDIAAHGNKSNLNSVSIRVNNGHNNNGVYYANSTKTSRKNNTTKSLPAAQETRWAGPSYATSPDPKKLPIPMFDNAPVKNGTTTAQIKKKLEFDVDIEPTKQSSYFGKTLIPGII
jgi:hypothetical protein